jgi:hypothetical protein
MLNGGSCAVLVLWLCSLLGSHTRSYLHIRMQTLSEYVDDTEDFINIELDSHRNQVCFDLCSPAHRSHPSSPLLTPPHPSSPLLTSLTASLDPPSSLIC